MMEIIIISALAKNNVIGNKGAIPWHIKEDFQRFKRITLGHPIIMGRKTYQSLPQNVRPLPGRTNIVLTRQTDFAEEGVFVFQSFEDALNYCKKEKCEKVFIGGGKKVYEVALPFANTLELTRVEKEYEGDTLFPPFSEEEWQLEKEEPHEGFSFQTFKRKQK
jgi:dihydrofolate reductase